MTLKLARLLNGYTKEDVANILGITIKTLERFENRPFGDLRIDQVLPMLELYKISIDEMEE